MLLAIIAVLSIAAALGAGFAADAFASAAFLWILPLTFVGSFVVLLGLTVLTVWIITLFIDLDKPQEKDSRFHRRLTYLVADTICSVLRMRIHTRGLEKMPKLPKDGRFLLVCNHIHDLDPVVLLKYTKKSQLAFISKRENATMFVAGKIMHRLMCQMVNRENDREAMRTIIKCIQLIKEDQVSIAVFPEGYTSRDGLLHPFRHGVFKIAQKAKVPIVVCTMQNTNRVLKNFFHLKRTHVHFRLVDVIPPEVLEGKTTVEVGTMVHEMMAKDLGEDLVLKETT